MAQEFEKASLRSSPKILENAKRLRKNLTDAERKLWEKLRNRKLRGLKFRRQHPVHNCVADFFCAEHKVIIELDGGIHLSKEQKEIDQVRTQELEALGIRVIRFKNGEVLLQISNTLKRNEELILPRPSPNKDHAPPKA